MSGGAGILSDLPEIEGLDAASARDVVGSVRRDLVPPVLDELLGLYSAAPEGGTASIRILELELTFQALAKYCDTLEASLGLADELVPAHEAEPELVEVRTDGHASATCHARLFTCPMSRYFVHGPISMLHLVALAERLLRPGESIREIVDASWRRMVMNDLRLAVHDAAVPNVGGLDDAGGRAGAGGPSGGVVPAVVGSFRTSHGRTLRFSATQAQGAVTRECGYNGLTMALMSRGFSHPAGTATWRFGLSEFLNDAQVRRLNAPAVAAMTLTDLLSVGMVNMRKGNGRQVLLAGVKGLPLPPELGSLVAEAGGRVELHADRGEVRATRPGVYLLPVDYRFVPLQDGTARAMLAEVEVPYVRLLAQTAPAPRTTTGGGP